MLNSVNSVKFKFDEHINLAYEIKFLPDENCFFLINKHIGAWIEVRNSLKIL